MQSALCDPVSTNIYMPNGRIVLLIKSKAKIDYIPAEILSVCVYLSLKIYETITITVVTELREFY